MFEPSDTQMLLVAKEKENRWIPEHTKRKKKTFVQVCSENVLKISCAGTGEIQHAARDLKSTVINLIALSRTCQDDQMLGRI